MNQKNSVKRARSDSDKEERRTLLLNAALDEFDEKGFSQARMDDIAKRAGIAKGTLYLYFDSKDALFEALVETHALPNIAAMERAVAQFDGFRPALQALLHLAPHLIRHSDMPRLMKVLISNASTFPETVREYRQKVIDRVIALLSGLIEKGQQSGEVRAVDPTLTARLVMAPIAFSGLWQVVFAVDQDASFDLDKYFALHRDYLERALLMEPSP